MKPLNFSVVEILPSLLNKTKTSTIRPAWKECDYCIPKRKTLEKYPEVGFDECEYCLDKIIIKKPPRYKVGDKVSLYWNQRSKYEWFWIENGTEVNKIFTDTTQPLTHTGFTSKIFNKLLGTAEITEVFKIEINKTTEFYKDSFFIRGPDIDKEDLAKRDGFSSAEKFFRFFDKQYDLSQPREFYVYRWKWID